MKLDYVPNGSPDCPLLRLSEFPPSEAELLRLVLDRLASGSTQRIEVERLPFTDAVGGCSLALVVRPRDEGVRHVPGTSAFICGLTRTSWSNVEGLVEPFTGGATGYQWLVGSPGDLPLLLSVNGDW